MTFTLGRGNEVVKKAAESFVPFVLGKDIQNVSKFVLVWIYACLLRQYSDFLDYVFKYYLTFYHSSGLMNQDHYTALLNGDPDATKNTSESINKCLKTYVSAEKKYPHSFPINLQLQNGSQSKNRIRRTNCKTTTGRIN